MRRPAHARRLHPSRRARTWRPRAGAGTSACSSTLLAGVERGAAAPGMIGDVEGHLVGSVKLGLVEALVTFRPPREALGAELLKLVSGALDVLDQHAEMMDAAEIEPEPLVQAEVQHR